MIPEELKNKYHVLKQLHRGIGGDVWLAEHIGLSGRRVLKSIEKSHPQYDALAREAKILQQCRHPSIPIIYDILEFDTQIFIVEEFLEGENLKQYILRNRRLDVSILLSFSIQLCEILKFLHNPQRPILYLDLKPENILISDHNLKLVDFGSAIPCGRLKSERFIFGTPGFCAPEMKSNGILAERTDIYCLGRCFEFMLFYTKGAPKGYQRIMKRCLREYGREYAEAEEIIQDLKRLEGKKKKEKTTENWYAVMGTSSEEEGGMAALQLAAWLQRRFRQPVLLLDCSEGKIMDRLEPTEQNQKKIREQQSFVFERDGITVAKRVAPQEIRGWRRRGYRYIICSFGKMYPEWFGCSFDACLCAGVVTEFSLSDLKNILPPVCRENKTIFFLTGGDEALAKRYFGRMCVIQRMPLFFHGFGYSKDFGRQMKRLLKKM